MKDIPRPINSAQEPVPQRAGRWPGATPFYGWWVVLACTVGLFWGPPVTVFSFSVFLKPLMLDFHAGRGAVSLGFTLHLLATAAIAPLVGWLVDRFGSRKVILLATSIFGSMLLLNRPLSPGLGQFYLFNIALGLVATGVGPLPYGRVVSLWFDRSRGLALGLMMVGIGSGAMTMPSFAQWLIAKFGWHAAYAVLGGAVLFIALPVVAVLLREKPEDMGLLQDGTLSKAVEAESRALRSGLSSLDALRTGTFWLMTAAFSLVSASVQGCIIHLAAMFSDYGISPQAAALGSSVAGATILLGRVGTGFLLDRFFAPRVATAFFGGAAVGIGLLWIGNTKTILFAGALFVGLGLGAELDLIAFLISRYFGLRAFGTIYGSAFAAFALAGAIGPLIMGAGFDSAGSYRAPLACFLAATLVATVLMARLGPYRYRAGERDVKEQIVLVPAEERPGGV